MLFIVKYILILWMLKYVKFVYLIIDEILYFLMELIEVELRDIKFS